MDVPLLLLTAKGSVKDKVTGLNAGADDYLAKPFEFEELLARIQALLRRKSVDKTMALKIGDLELNQLTHRVFRARQQITLTSKEYSLLQYMMLHAHQVVTRTMIFEHVWNEDFDTLTNVIDVHINYLRNKIDLRRLFFNLIDNAIKFSPKGTEIGINVRAENGKGRVSVSDQGIGIAQTDLPHVFEKFYHGVIPIGIVLVPSIAPAVP